MIRNIRLKRSSKFLLLLLTSILVGTANAAIFYSLTMEPQVTVSMPVLKFSTAPDQPSGSTVNDAWAMLAADSYPNATLTYEKAMYINNTDATNAHSFRLRHVGITPANGSATVGNWTNIKFQVYNETGFVFSLEYAVTSGNWTLTPNSGQTSYYSIPANTGWWIRLETLSPDTATIGETCGIQIGVDVLQ